MKLVICIIYFVFVPQFGFSQNFEKDSILSVFQAYYWYHYDTTYRFNDIDTLTFINRTECSDLTGLGPRISCMQLSILNKRKLKLNESSSNGYISTHMQYLDNSNIFRYKIIKRKGVLFLRIVNSYHGMTKYKIIFLKHELCEREQPVRTTYQWSLQLIKIPFD